MPDRIGSARPMERRSRDKTSQRMPGACSPPIVWPENRQLRLGEAGGLSWVVSRSLADHSDGALPYPVSSPYHLAMA